MPISVIIPTCHRNDLLAQCLLCLAPGAQALPSGDYEVIVTDDGSTTTAAAMVRERFPWVRWVQGPRRGPAANRNNGAKQARGEWLVFVDDDCLPDRGLLVSYAGTARQQPGMNVLEGRTYPDRACRSLAEVCPANETGGYLWSCNFAIRKSLFDSMGGFDERFPSACMEDVDFRDRLGERGERFAFVPAASVCHPWRPRRIRQELRQQEASVAIYLSLHPEKRADLGPYFYLFRAARSLVKITIPGLWRYRGAGLSCALREHFADFRMALKMIWSR